MEAFEKMLQVIHMFQCINCGKLFLSSQQIQYQRHLATHEFDLDANAVSILTF